MTELENLVFCLSVSRVFLKPLLGGMNIEYQPVDIKKKFSLFSDCWSPKIIGKLNNV